MNKGDGRINQKVRRLCRAINNRADDREKLQTLVVQLQEVLRETYETRAVKLAAQSENPFDKIIIV
jgi:hypothetical protein